MSKSNKKVKHMIIVVFALLFSCGVSAKSEKNEFKKELLNHKGEIEIHMANIKKENDKVIRLIAKYACSDQAIGCKESVIDLLNNRINESMKISSLLRESECMIENL